MNNYIGASASDAGAFHRYAQFSASQSKYFVNTLYTVSLSVFTVYEMT